jgi:hypothetical protein
VWGGSDLVVYTMGILYNTGILEQRRIDSLGGHLAGEALEREAVFRRHEGQEGREDLVGRVT